MAEQAESPIQNKKGYNKHITFKKIERPGMRPKTTPQKKVDEEEYKMTTCIREEINSLITEEEVINHKFYFVYFNITCKTDQNIYIPSEVGFVEYSVVDGIINEYHQFIYPGEIPRGYKFICKERSEKTGIPFENFEKANSNYEEVYNNLKDFVKNGLEKKVVYAKPERIEQIEKCLGWLHVKSGQTDDIVFEVRNILILLEQLRIRCYEPINSTMAREFMNKSSFEYIPRLGCSWHDEVDRVNYCALSVVKRLAYLLSQHVCLYFGLDLIPGKHFPPDQTSFPDLGASGEIQATSHEYNSSNRKGKWRHIKCTYGKSAVFQPDSVEIYGQSFEDMKKLQNMGKKS